MKKERKTEPARPKPTLKQIIIYYPGIDYVQPSYPSDYYTNRVAKKELETNLAWAIHRGFPLPGQGGHG